MGSFHPSCPSKTSRSKTAETLSSSTRTTRALSWSSSCKKMLYFAAAQGHLDFLIERVESGDFRKKHLRYCLRLALPNPREAYQAQAGRVSRAFKTIRYLAGITDNINDADKDGYTVLLKACYWGQKDLVKFLVETAKADVHARTRKGESALLLAIQAGNLELVKYLVRNTEIDVNSKRKDGCTALMLAVCMGEIGMTTVLLNEARCDKSMSHLHEVHRASMKR
eukprot:590138-Amorphochlora_amoeboformis.AAC.2